MAAALSTKSLGPAVRWRSGGVFLAASQLAVPDAVAHELVPLVPVVRQRLLHAAPLLHAVVLRRDGVIRVGEAALPNGGGVPCPSVRLCFEPSDFSDLFLVPDLQAAATHLPTCRVAPHAELVLGVEEGPQLRAAIGAGLCGRSGDAALDLDLMLRNGEVDAVGGSLCVSGRAVQNIQRNCVGLHERCQPMGSLRTPIVVVLHDIVLRLVRLRARELASLAAAVRSPASYMYNSWMPSFLPSASCTSSCTALRRLVFSSSLSEVRLVLEELHHIPLQIVDLALNLGDAAVDALDGGLEALQLRVDPRDLRREPCEAHGLHQGRHLVHSDRFAHGVDVDVVAVLGEDVVQRQG